MRDDGKAVADYQSFALLTQTSLLFVVSIQVEGNILISLNSTECKIIIQCIICVFCAAGLGDVLLDGGEHLLCFGQLGHVFCRHIHYVQ